MPINLCLQILNATDALQKFYERKKIIILEDARMQKPGAPVVKGTRHKGGVCVWGGGGGDLTFWNLGTARTFATESFVEWCPLFEGTATTHMAYILLESKMTLALWEHPVKGTCVCADAHL